MRTTARKRYKQSLPASWRKRAAGDGMLDDTGRSWRWGRKNGQYYYDVDRIPNRKPCNYRDMLPTKDDLIAMVDDAGVRASRERSAWAKAQIREYIASTINNDDARYYIKYTHADLSIFGRDKAAELAEALAWCRMLRDGRPERFGIATMAELYKTCIEIIAPRKLEGLRLTTAASLRKKVSCMPEGCDRQRTYMISTKYGNDNRRVIGKNLIVDTETGELMNFDMHEAIIMEYWLNAGGVAKASARSLWERYSADMEALGETPLKYRTYTGYVGRYSTRMLSVRERHGQEYFNKNYMTYVPTEPLKYANSLWCADASGVIDYRYRDRDGVIRRRKIYALLISDVASRKIVGYAVAPEGTSEEKPKMFADALRMALINNGTTEALELITDNHGTYTSKESKALSAMAFRFARTIAPHNSQANPAEQMFRLFKQSLKMLENLYETSFAPTGINSQANPDYWDNLNLPTYAEAKVQLSQLIERWNSEELTDGTSPNSRFENKNPEAKEYDPQIYRMLTGNYSQVDLSYMRGFVNVNKTIDGYRSQKYQYQIPQSPEVAGLIARHMGYSSKVLVDVYWDDLVADVYTRAGRFMFSCQKPIRASQAHYESSPEQRAALSEHLAGKEAQQQAADTYVTGIVAAAETVHGNKYALAMADNGFKSSPKERWNAMQEGIDPDVAPKLMERQQKKAIKAAATEARQEAQTAEDKRYTYYLRKMEEYGKANNQ